MLDHYDSLSIDNKLIQNFRDIGHTMRNISESKGSQKRILIILNENGPIAQSELTSQLEIQPGSVSEVLGKLEASGLIVRVASTTDRRTTDILLTKAGQEAAEEASAQRNARHTHMFSCFPEEEKETLLALLEKINVHWDRQYRQNSMDQAFPGTHKKHGRL